MYTQMNFIQLRAKNGIMSLFASLFVKSQENNKAQTKIAVTINLIIHGINTYIVVFLKKTVV